MKKIVALLLWLTINSFSFSQHLKYGLQLSLGTTYTKSQDLQNYMTFENNSDVDIKEYLVSGKPGLTFGIGASVKYEITDQIKLVAYPGFQYRTSNMKIDKMEDDSQSGLSYRLTTDSDNMLNFASFELPILAQYSFSDEIFFEGGLGASLLLSSKINAKETILDEEFNGMGNLITSQTITKSNEADIHEFSSPRFSLILGAGKKMDFNGSLLSLSLRYFLPLSTSRLFTNDVLFDSNTEESDVFTIYEQVDIRNDGFQVDDFKNGTIMITIDYDL